MVGGVCSLCSSDSCIGLRVVRPLCSSDSCIEVNRLEGCVRCVVVTHVSRLRVTGGVCSLCSSDSCIVVKSGWRGVFVV